MLSRLATSRMVISEVAKKSAPRFASTVFGYQQTTNKSIQNSIRLFHKSNRLNSRQFGAKEPVKEAIRAKPVREFNPATMNQYGMMVLGGAGALGIATLCFYGLGLSNQEGALERSMVWPQYVKDRIHTTYTYLASGLGITASAAYLGFRTPALLALASRGGIMMAIGTIAAIMISGAVVQSIPYEPGFGPKQVAWAAHCALLGLVLAPLTMVGGPILLKAATYTAGVVGGLSTIAICAPSEKFLMQSAPLSIGLGIVVASSIGSLFLPPTTKLGLGLYGVALYGGLLLFSGMLLYDTQKTIKQAEVHPMYSMHQYDPVNHSLHLYMDTLNIFIRIVQVLIMGGNGRKK